MIAVVTKKVKGTKKYATKQETQLEGYKNYQEVNQLENAINWLEKNNIVVGELKESHK